MPAFDSVPMPGSDPIIWVLRGNPQVPAFVALPLLPFRLIADSREACIIDFCEEGTSSPLSQVVLECRAGWEMNSYAAMDRGGSVLFHESGKGAKSGETVGK